MRHFPGKYSDDWKEVQALAVEEAGHRCVRCLHPYRKGNHGNGEWSPCDEQCCHGGPVKFFEESGHPMNFAKWRILTTHHFDGNKANNAWWNLLVLCQRCHLQIQGKVDPEIPYFFEHSPWIKPYAAGFYAWKYEHRLITRKDAEIQLDALLAYERRA